MEPGKRLLSFSSRSSSNSSMEQKRDSLLPYSEVVSEKMSAKLHNPLGHCLYKRVIIWTALSLFMAGFVLFGRHEGTIGEISSTRAGQGSASVLPTDSNAQQLHTLNSDELARDEAQKQIDAARESQGQSQLHVPSEKFERPEDNSDEDAEDNDKEDSSNTSKNNGEKTDNTATGSESDEEEFEEYEVEDEEEGIPEYDQNAEEAEMNLLLEGENTEQLKKELENLKKMPWLRFPQ